MPEGLLCLLLSLSVSSCTDATQTPISAIPRLRRLLENDSEVAKVRREAAKALKQLGEQIPMLIAQINNGVESIRLVEHPSTVEIDLGNKIILEMVQIPGGTFLMGAPPQEKDSDDSERPQHQVTISSFLMTKYPITQVQWQAIASLLKVERNLDPKPTYFTGADHPVEQVNWYDAVEFCARLSQKQGGNFGCQVKPSGNMHVVLEQQRHFTLVRRFQVIWRIIIAAIFMVLKKKV